ncbi:hypothetical protein DMH04_00370 [Kibdelosporangium aridum]|uniref:Uncharacterized protein n=1 Tax=Kibdelosporangium aridum TaxID=2030 RepID=A0A428ZTZ7_KIBAR|nr:hypothetical protein [Kibdelosporangium aridum]RSM91497.1 hypothetical protein DMH04_00370 [Kibdelosporangium aridum]
MSDELANSIVRALSQYLVWKAGAGSAAFDANLENLHGLLSVKMSDAFQGELLGRFTDNPTSTVEQQALRVHLAEEIRRDPEFGRELGRVLAGQIERGSKMPGKKTMKRGFAILGAAVIVTGTFIIGRSTANVEAVPTPTPAPVTVTSVVQVSPTATPVPSPSSSSSVVAPPPSGSGVVPGTPGDGSSLPKGTPVFVKDLPKPNNQSYAEFGDHDVRLTQYQNSLWHPLSTCNDDRYKGEQQFNLKNFSRIEVQAVGTDQTSDPSLVVKFEIFINNDKVKPIATVVANPGESKQLGADLPPDTFALTLRSSLVTVDKSKCRSGNAVWGTPFVTAVGR